MRKLAVVKCDFWDWCSKKISKIQISTKNPNFDKNLNFSQKFRQKIKILIKNFDEKSKFWPKISTKTQNLAKNRKFRQKSKLPPKNHIFLRLTSVYGKLFSTPNFLPLTYDMEQKVNIIFLFFSARYLFRFFYIQCCLAVMSCPIPFFKKFQDRSLAEPASTEASAAP